RSLPANGNTCFVWYFRSRLAVRLGHPPRHLLARHILYVRGDGPPMPEWIDDVPVPVSVELVLGGALQRCSEFHRAGDDRVDVLDVDEQEGRKAGQAAGRRGFG